MFVNLWFMFVVVEFVFVWKYVRVCVGQRVSVPFSIDMLLHFRQRITISLNIWLQPQVFEQASDYFELKPQTLIFRSKKLQMLG